MNVRKKNISLKGYTYIVNDYIQTQPAFSVQHTEIYQGPSDGTGIVCTRILLLRTVDTKDSKADMKVIWRDSSSSLICRHWSN